MRLRRQPGGARLTAARRPGASPERGLRLAALGVAAALAACAHAQSTPAEPSPRLAPAPPAPAPAPALAPAPAAAAPAAAPAVAPPRPACAPYPAEAGERTLSSGGDLDLSCVPSTSVTTEGDTVVAWGLSEVPGASRLQAALALADAAARAELVASVQVGVASLFRSAGRTDQGGQGSALVLERVTAQAASGLLPALAPPVHGWRKVKRGAAEVLIVAARLVAGRRAVQESVEASLWAAQQKEGGSQDAPDVAARKVVEALGAGRALFLGR